MAFIVGSIAIGLGAATSLYGSIQAGKAADKSLANASYWSGLNYDLQKEQYDWTKARAEKEDRQRDAAMAPLWNIVNTPGVYGWGDMESKVKGFYRNADTGTDAAMRQSGMLGTGMDAAAHQANKLAEAKKMSEAWQQGLMSKADIAAKIGGAYNPNQAAGLVRSPDLGPNINTSMGLAGMAGAAGSAWGGFGGNIANWAMNRMAAYKAPPPGSELYKPPPPPAPEPDWTFDAGQSLFP